jgi:hypothetical protein
MGVKSIFMDEFILILRHPDGSKIASPEQIQIWMKQTMDWIGGIAAQNKDVGGQGLLFDDSRVVSRHSVVTNGPYGEIAETIGGYMIVRADSIDEAVEFAKGCPILQAEVNSVEVRKIARRDGVH